MWAIKCNKECIHMDMVNFGKSMVSLKVTYIHGRFCILYIGIPQHAVGFHCSPGPRRSPRRSPSVLCARATAPRTRPGKNSAPWWRSADLPWTAGVPGSTVARHGFVRCNWSWGPERSLSTLQRTSCGCFLLHHLLGRLGAVSYQDPTFLIPICQQTDTESLGIVHQGHLVDHV